MVTHSPDLRMQEMPHEANVDLATLTTMATPGVARLVVTPPDAGPLQTLLRDLAEAKRPFILLGGGSNVIFTRTEVRPVVIRLGSGFEYVKPLGEAGHLCVGAATPLSQLLRHALRENLAGLEWAVGIPGTVGGAVVGNAGAGGEGMGDSVVRAVGFTRTGDAVTLERDRLKFEYRNSNLRDLVLTEVDLQLMPDDRAAIQARMAVFRDKRRGQPYGDHSSGCVFRNPPGDHAGRLIDSAGLKGFGVGCAHVSRDHANFLVNDGEAPPEDVLRLIEEVRRRVQEQAGVTLETEVILIDPDRVEAAQ